MLLNTFFDIVYITQNQKDGEALDSSDSYTVQIRLHPDHPIFKGHFPGNPVVPGVCQVRIVTEIISEILGKEVRLLEADPIKFLSMINPNEHPELTVECTMTPEERGGLKVTASISDDGLIFFKSKSNLA